jgi:hypothetical protein
LIRLLLTLVRWREGKNTPGLFRKDEDMRAKDVEALRKGVMLGTQHSRVFFFFF